MQHIRRRHKQHLRQVVFHIEIVVLERIILLRIQHLQQRRRRVAAEVRGHLVDLIQHDHRVLRPGLLHRLNNLSRQRSNVRPAMSANLRLIAHATQRQPHKLSPRRLRNRHPQRRLTYARRSNEAQNRSLRILHQLPHRKKFQDAILDLLKPVVIFIQHRLRVLDRTNFLRPLLPRYRQQPVQIVPAHRRLSRHRRHRLQLLQLLHGLFLHVLGHACFFNLLLQLVEFTLLAAPKFLLNRFDLLVEVVLFLRALHLALHPRLDRAIHVQLLNRNVQRVRNARQPHLRIEHL